MNTNKALKTGRRKVLRIGPFLLLIVLIISVCFFMGAAFNNNNIKINKEGIQKEYISIMVKKGDTIWGLIKEARPDYSGNIQKVVHEVKQINGLSGSIIYPGQILEIPLN